jgi:hypothetical protein
MNNHHTESEALKQAKSNFYASQKFQRSQVKEVKSMKNQQNQSVRPSLRPGNTKFHLKPTRSVHVSQTSKQPLPSRSSSSSSQVGSTNKSGKIIRIMQRPDYMQVVSDRPNAQFYHFINHQVSQIGPPPPPIIRQEQLSRPEQIQNTLSTEYTSDRMSRVLSDIADLRQELKRDIDGALASIELLKQEHLALKSKCCCSTSSQETRSEL